MLDKVLDIFTAGTGLEKNINTNACPACEYKYGTRGRPVSSHGSLVCLSCGNEWKEVSHLQCRTSTVSGLPATNQRKVNLETQTVSEYANVEQKTYKPQASKSGPVGVLFAAMLLLAGVVGTYAYMSTNLNPYAAKGVFVSNLHFEEIVRHNQGKVVQVRGTILNSDDRSNPINRLALILRKSNGSELTRWYYTSPVTKLSPGGKTQFVSSIQYDTPIIASVDAVFD